MIIKLTDRYGDIVRVNFDNVLYYQPNSGYKTFNTNIKMIDKTVLDVKETVEEIDKLVGIYEEEK